MLTRQKFSEQSKRMIDTTGRVKMQDGTVEKFCVLRMFAGERGRWEGLFKDRDGSPHKTRRFQVREYLIIFTLCDENGIRVYPLDPDEIEKYVEEIAAIDGNVVDAISAHSMEFNAVSDEDMGDLSGNLPMIDASNSATS